MIQRTLAFLLCAVMLFSLISCQQNNGASKEPSATETTSPPPSPVEDFEYEIITVSEETKSILEVGDYSDTYIDIQLDSEGLIRITKYIGTDKNVVIPSEIDGIPVNSIGMKAFMNTQAETVWLPESVENIGDRAFYELSTLTAVYGGKGLRMIGAEAFAECQALTTIDLSSDTLQIILKLAFYNCLKLTGVSFGNSLSELERQAFSCCKSLKHITIPKSVVKWEAGAFAGCDALTEVTLEEGLTVFRGDSFWAADSLKTITIPASITEMDANLFRTLESELTEIIFKGNAPTITIDLDDPLYASDVIIYYDPNTEGWDTTPLKDYFTLVPIE